MQVCDMINERGNKKPFRFFTQKLGQVNMRSKIKKINNMAVLVFFFGNFNAKEKYINKNDMKDIGVAFHCTQALFHKDVHI